MIVAKLAQNLTRFAKASRLVSPLRPRSEVSDSSERAARRARNRRKMFSVGFAFLFSVSLALLPLAAGAEEKLTLSVTPPLFQLSIGPGEFWASSLKVVNVNSYDLTLYASVMNFRAEGEEGRGKLTPIINEEPEVSANSLAQWIEVSKEPIFVPREKSIEVPFSVRIPDNAPPGGHYAAILVGTQPLKEESEGSVIRVSSLVSSLLFVRIKGDIREEGIIREFSTEKTLYQKPEVAFTLRFRNTGNVHLQPQGDIVISNMWGKERGTIPVNQKTSFGNVLPQSIRKFVFEWRGENNFFEVGRYKAVATLSFGEEAHQNVFRTAYFWVVPLKPTLGILGSLITFILIIAWGIRVYIRRTLALARQEVGEKRKWISPIQEKVLDLRDVVKQTQNLPSQIFKENLGGQAQNRRERFGVSLAFLFRVSLALLKKHALFFIFVVLLIGEVMGLAVYFKQVFVKERSFEIFTSEDRSGSAQTRLPSPTAEDVQGQVATQKNAEEIGYQIQDTNITVLNGGGIPDTRLGEEKKQSHQKK